MHPYTLEGIIIKRRNWGEADRIITLFSKEQGKVSLKAAGVRKISSRRAGSLELFNRVKISAVAGRANWDVLTEVAVLDTFTSWRKHLGRVNLAYQLCEVVDKMTPDNQPQPEVYDLLVTAFSSLGSLGENWESEIKNWILKILIILGYWPQGKKFTGDIYKFIEEVANHPLNSPEILKKLSSHSASRTAE
jgi:DNA repair protein RecO (recombination protein O)